jgi:hypothetical protein
MSLERAKNTYFFINVISHVTLKKHVRASELLAIGLKEFLYNLIC